MNINNYGLPIFVSLFLGTAEIAYAKREVSPRNPLLNDREQLANIQKQLVHIEQNLAMAKVFARQRDNIHSIRRAQDQIADLQRQKEELLEQMREITLVREVEMEQ